MESFFFEIPWWFVAAMVAAGVAVFIAGNNRTNSAQKFLGVGILLLATTMTAVSYFVDTDREIVELRTRQLVDSVLKNDWPRMGNLLDKDAHIGGWSGRDSIVSGTRAAITTHGLKAARVSALTAAVQPDGVLIISTFQVTTEHNEGVTVPTRWSIDWIKNGDQWQARQITPLESVFPGASQEINRLTHR